MLSKSVVDAINAIPDSVYRQRFEGVYNTWMHDKVEDFFEEIEDTIQEDCQKIADDLFQQIIDRYGYVPKTHVIQVGDLTHEIDGVVHEAFDMACYLVANDTPVFLSGPSGSGKNVLAQQIADSLGLDFYPINAVQDRFELTGFIDSMGRYQETPLYKAMKYGGVYFHDEFDASQPDAIITLNMAIANREMAFPNEHVKAHENFRVIVAGNTLGYGADNSYVGRQELDEATLNRFVTVPVNYDKNIDNLMADRDSDLVDFADAWRDAALSEGCRSVCSYRTVQQLKLLENFKGSTPATILFGPLLRGMNIDDVRQMKHRLSKTVSTPNKWMSYLNDFIDSL